MARTVLPPSSFPMIAAFFLCFSCCCLAHATSSLMEPSRPTETYIIHVDRTPDHFGSHQEWHESILVGAVSKSRLVYSYGHVLSAFAARLTEEELEALKSVEGFVSAVPDRVHTSDTTYSPRFLGLRPGAGCFWGGSAGYGRGVIVGIIDTGITPGHPSFDDTGMPPPPPKWNGLCMFGDRSLCNNKLIGARSFIDGNMSGEPFDEEGHGTHVASTAAGRFVGNASVLGSAFGTAAGVAPDAHLAVYKAVSPNGKFKTSNILAAIEWAVKDGVDVISMSISDDVVPFYEDFIAIAFFGAMKRGVFVSSTGGNRGPERGTVAKVSPWILTVGASSMDRRIRAVVRTGDGMQFEGESAYQPTTFPSTLLPLVYPLSAEDPTSTLCNNSATLHSVDVRGKLVLCDAGEIDGIEKGAIVKEAGGVAMVMINLVHSGFQIDAAAHVIPASEVTSVDGAAITEYIRSVPNPTATITFLGTEIGVVSAPEVAPFSSRGPSEVSPGVIKPDIIGPGVNILAAWPSPVGAFAVTPAFNMISGTSMACPHLSGIAALLKSSHPDWSPAMIKSAIMTTSHMSNHQDGPILDQYDNSSASFYDMGAGQVDPVRAGSPGLVYDLQANDYVAYLCGIGYTNAQVNVISHPINPVDCAALQNADLNYPSALVSLKASNNFKAQIFRTVTNVGEVNSTYAAVISPPRGVTMVVRPEKLYFGAVGKKAQFAVTFGLSDPELARSAECKELGGFFTWVSSDGQTTVRSPVMVTVAC